MLNTALISLIRASILILITGIESTPALAAYNKRSIQADLDHIIKQFTPYHVGVIVQSLDNGKILYQHNANKIFIPASTLKLFTGIAALDYLGPDFKFTTHFLTTSPPVKQGILTGNLYIKFSGDPYFTLENLKGMLATLARQNIKKIQGDIV